MSPPLQHRAHRRGEGQPPLQLEEARRAPPGGPRPRWPRATPRAACGSRRRRPRPRGRPGSPRRATRKPIRIRPRSAPSAGVVVVADALAPRGEGHRRGRWRRCRRSDSPRRSGPAAWRRCSSPPPPARSMATMKGRIASSRGVTDRCDGRARSRARRLSPALLDGPAGAPPRLTLRGRCLASVSAISRARYIPVRLLAAQEGAHRPELPVAVLDQLLGPSSREQRRGDAAQRRRRAASAARGRIAVRAARGLGDELVDDPEARAGRGR